MSANGFYKSWLKAVFSKSFSVADGIAGALGALVPAASPLFPQWETLMSQLAWQIPLGFFVAVVLVRMASAPGTIHSEQQRTIEALQASTPVAFKYERSRFSKPERSLHGSVMGVFLILDGVTLTNPDSQPSSRLLKNPGERLILDTSCRH